jgi:hypothetical protein
MKLKDHLLIIYYRQQCLINHPWDRIKCLASCLIKNIFFLRLRDGNTCFYCHNTLKAYILTFSKCDGNKFNDKSPSDHDHDGSSYYMLMLSQCNETKRPFTDNIL